MSVRGHTEVGRAVLRHARRWWRRKWGRWVVLAALVVVLVVVLLTQSPLTKRLLLPPLARALNMDISARSVRISPSGEIVLRGAQFRVPGVAGPAGQFMRVERAAASLDWGQLRRGNVARAVREIELRGPVVVISQSLDDRTLNVARLAQPPAAAGAQGTAGQALVIPRVTLVDASVELGEHTGDTYTALKRLTMDGRLEPTRDAGTYALRLRESGPGAGAGSGSTPPELDRALKIEGLIKGDSASATISNFSLTRWGPRNVPASIREIFRDLDLSGDVPRATFSYGAAEGVRAELELRDVAMNLPIDPDPSFNRAEPVFGPPLGKMRMRGVKGTIALESSGLRAEVSGRVEDLPYIVRLDYRGTTLDAPFDIDFESPDFRIDRNPALMPYAPPKVRQWVTTFSSPTAQLAARARVSRGEPQGGQPGAITVAGSVDVRNGTAAYEGFPYEFREIAGRFEFSDTFLRITGLTGKAPAGGTLTCEALVEPLDDSAQVDVKVRVRGVPVDEAMERSFPSGRGNIIQALFNTRRYQELVAAGLVRTASDAEREREELQRLRLAPDAPGAAERIVALEARSRVPVFALGGNADVDVDIFSPRGVGVPWTTTINISIPEARLVPDKFPHPIVGRNIVAQVKDDRGTLLGGEFAGLLGGAARVKADFRVPKRTGPDDISGTRIEIDATGMPWTPLVLQALPGEASPGGERPAIKRILGSLGIEAKADAKVTIAPREEPGQPLGFDAECVFVDARISPAPFAGAPAVEATKIAGTLRASEDRLSLSLAGELRGPGAMTPAERGLADGPQHSAIEVDLSYEFPDEGEAAGRASVRAPSLDLSTPVQSLLWVFSPEAAGAVHELWRDHAPGGQARAEVAIDVPAGRPTAVDVALTPLSAMTARIGDRTIELEPEAGTSPIRLVRGERTSVEFAGTSARVRVDGRGAGTVRLDGAAPLDRPRLGDEPKLLTIALASTPVESPLVMAALERTLSPDTLTRVREMDPRGVFDADLRITTLPPAPDAPLPEPGAEKIARSIAGTLRPRELSVTFEGTRIALPSMSGEIEFEPGGGIIRRLRAGAPEAWWVELDGSWMSGERGVLELSTRATGEATRLGPELTAALPGELQRAIESVSLKVDGALSLKDIELTLVRGEDRPARTELRGGVEFAEAGIDVGAEIDGAAGRAELLITRGATTADEKTRVDVSVARARVSGVWVTDAEATIEQEPGGTLAVRGLQGRVHGGRATGEITITRDAGGRVYQGDLRLAGVRFKPLLDDANAGSGEGKPRAAGDELSRGIIDAGVAFQGRVGDAASRRGRGEIHISRRGSRVLELPLVLRLVEASNLQLPINEGIDTVAARFYIDGATMVFEDLSAYSRTVALLGYGTMTLPGRELDLRFNSKAGRRIWGLSALIEGIRDEIISTRVRGTLEDPKIEIVQFPGPRRAVGRAVGRTIGDGESETDKLMGEIERRGEAIRAEHSGPPRRIPATPGGGGRPSER